MYRNRALVTAALLIAALGASACSSDGSSSEAKPSKKAYCAEVRELNEMDDDDMDVDEVVEIARERLMPVAPDDIRSDIETWMRGAESVENPEEFAEKMDSDAALMEAMGSLTTYSSEECGV